MKRFLAGGLAALALGVTTQAHATTYLLDMSQTFGNVSDPSAANNYGTVTVTQAASNELEFVVTLAAGFNFVDTGSHEAFSFALKGDPAITLSGVPLATSKNGETGFSLASSDNNIANAPFKDFDYALACSDLCDPNGGGYKGNTTNPNGDSTLTFYVTAKSGDLTTSMIDFATSTYDKSQIAFAADVIAKKGTDCAPGCDCSNGGTGTVGGGDVEAVPEPASWAMMIIGLFAGGAALRRRRYSVTGRLAAAAR
jgi:hypothetical protein